MNTPPDSTHSTRSSQSSSSSSNPGTGHPLLAYSYRDPTGRPAAMARHDSPEKRRRVAPPSPNSISPASTSDTSHATSRTSTTSFAFSATHGGFTTNIEHDYGGETASLTHSAREHTYEHGLRYHGYRPGLYAFPNDEAEQERDALMHELSVQFWEGKHFLAPVEKRLALGAQVLDLGTGIGVWCEQLADKYPLSSFEGIDLSPIQSAEVPPNVRFCVDDMEHEQGWNFDGHKFDFIHLRHTLHSVRNRPELFKRAYEHLKPGGYFEIQELECAVFCDDGTVPAGSDYALRTWLDALDAGLRARGGSDLRAIRGAAAELKAAGFDAVDELECKCPVGTWAADDRRRLCGGLLTESILAGLWGMSARPLAALDWNRAQIEMVLVSVREHVRNPRFHAYMPFRTVWGRKPLR